MISFKKSYAEKMLQLALALSLLQVDPRDYLNQGWDSQLELHNGDGWQLEMLRAVPISEYPYANRKAMMPLIEDLIRFDRQNVQDITTYLLNVQNAQNNYTNSFQDHDNSAGSTINSSSSNSTNSNNNPASTTTANNNNNNNNNGATSNGGGSSEAAFIEQLPNLDNIIIPNFNEFDLFLNSNSFDDDISIADQNLADLGEYGDIPLSSFPYFGLPLKDEPPDNFVLPNLLINQELPSTSNGDDYFKNPSTSTNTVNPGLNLENIIVKKELSDNDGNIGIGNLSYNDDIKLKKDAEEPEVKVKIENDTKNQDDIEKDTVGPILNNIELTKEESEIVEVLWKQDVDLGYSLAPPKLTQPTDSSSLSSTSSKKSEDEVEKLKALEELKQDKAKDDDNNKPELDDEWAGIPFRIDNETGEYIRQPLQLDEILQDVLQLSELTVDDIVQEESTEIKEESEKDLKEQINFSFENPSSLITSATTSVNGTAIIEPPQSEVEISSLPSPLFDFEDACELEADLEMMIQSTAGPFQHHRTGQNYGPTNSAFRQSGFHHHHHHQPRVPLTRGLSMEQRLQDIANLFNPIPAMGVGMGVGDMSPYSHYPTHYSYQPAPGMPPQHGQYPHHAPHPVLHNTSLTDISAGQPHYGHNIGSAVSSSMHLTNSTHETDPGAVGYKGVGAETEMMYYSNTSSELNHTDGFINSILNDEDLQLMDMGVNEPFCGMRMLDSNATSNTSSVLGSASAGSHSSSHLLTSSTMPTNIGPLGGNTAVGTAEALGSTGDRLDASSDSAVSSMGSERVPSLSDGEWGDAGSDSAQDYHHGKYGGPYDYSYSNRDVRQPVAQKKHHMFGKRYFQEQPIIPGPLTTHQSNSNHQHQPTDHISSSLKYDYEPYGLHHTPSGIGHNLEGAVGPALGKDHIPMMSNADIKYPCSLDFSVRTPRTPQDLINHNHTYTLPQGTGSTPRPQIRDKKQKRFDDEHLTRDEKRARSLNIPISVGDIINLPMDEFNERLSKYDLTENQLSLIRDIRRRGKNKVAAQNCRKRKLDQILSLEDEVKEVKRRKDRLYQEREAVYNERKRISNKFAALHRHVFQYLRDPDGNPCSPSEYSLQQAADGSVYLLRRENKKPDGNSNTNAPGANTGTTNNTHNNPTNGTSHHHHPHSHHQQHHHLPQGHPTSNHQKE